MVIFSTWVMVVMLFSMAMAIDRIQLPPLEEEFSSPTGTYKFKISTLDEWKSMRSTGELFKKDVRTYNLLWSRILPHNYRPRFVIVGEKGEVLLLDEWINVKSPFAVMLLDKKNQVVTQYDFNAIQKLLGIPGSELVKAARYGAWMMEPPKLNTDNTRVIVKTGHKELSIRLKDGDIILKTFTYN
jgi:hypothetical protein